jgi:peptidoglycan/LPS O-acetylase OafA/YrhL
MGQPKGHLRQLDGLRACLALCVVAHHCYLTIYPTVASLSWNNPSQIFWYGRFAVGWFIALSGYWLMIPVVKDASTEYRLSRGAMDFFRRRARRILPTFYAALVVSLIMCWTVVGSFEKPFLSRKQRAAVVEATLPEPAVQNVA